MSANFRRTSFKRWRCSPIFQNFWNKLMSVSRGWNCTKNYTQNIFYYKQQWFYLGTCSLTGDAAILFSPKFLWLFWDSIAWILIKFCMLYIYFERLHRYNFCEHSLLIGVTVVTILTEFLEKGKFCAHLNQIAQKFI